MKNLLLAALAFLLVGPAFAQKLAPAQVPPAVVATFQKTFPQATAVQWEKENADYEAGFQQAGTTMSALLSAGGELRETETGLAPSALPAPVRATLATRYKGSKVHEAARIVAAQTGAITYEAEVRQHGQHRDLLFTADGKEVAKK